MANSMDGQNSVLSVVGPLGTTASSLRLVTKALLLQQPWLHDPLVHEIPWRSEQEQEIQSLLQFVGETVPPGKKLTFGILHTDNVVSPTPPIRRALDLVTTALKTAGHTVIPWTPPSHKILNDTGFRSWLYDGGADVRSAFALSGEPLAPQVSLYEKSTPEFTASQIAETNVALRDLRMEYLAYWNSTSQESGTGRAVDAVIAPLAPWPAARREKYKYYGYTTWINVLDYTAVAFPVTNVDAGIDSRDAAFQPLDERDREIQDDCKFAERDELLLRLICGTVWCGVLANSMIVDDPDLYAGAHVSLQVVGRRLQEEKILAVAEYIGKLIGK